MACDSQGNKYVLDVAKVLGSNLTKVAAVLNPQSQWVVNFNLDSAGREGLRQSDHADVPEVLQHGDGNETSVLDQFAIVLDGKVVSAPHVNQPIPNGSGQITGPAPQLHAWPGDVADQRAQVRRRAAGLPTAVDQLGLAAARRLASSPRDSSPRRSACCWW